MVATTTRVGHGIAWFLRIKLDNPNDAQDDQVRRGESIFSVQTADTYVEEEPRSVDWVTAHILSWQQWLQYFRSLFPFTYWIGFYNLQWLLGDVVSGITIGAVVVPQGMAYAILAGLPPQYGLYTSFMGVLLYWFFATSKDITIGPVAVMSTLTGKILAHAAKTNPEVPGPIIATALALISGCIILALGLLRLGWIVELISLVSISAFMTGSALNIGVGQLPGLFGITGFDTRAETYKVFINFLKGLPNTKLDAAMGLTALFLLYVIRGGCSYAAKRYPSQRKTFFFLSTLRTAFVILLYTMISWLVNRNHRKKPLFKILSTVPRGFTAAKVPTINAGIINIFVSDLPVSVIVLLIEHISISKSFGRVNNYVINPSQELVAIGVTNILGPFLGAYPATGSFSRTAIKSKSGVRTPFAGVITAIVVLLAIYALPAVFFYIPNASLSAVIIHAVFDLITPPNTVYRFWRVSPLEVPIFFAGVLVTVFSSIENGIYTTIVVSFALFLFRFMKANGHFLGRVKVHNISGEHIIGDDSRPLNLIENGTFSRSVGPYDDTLSRSAFIPLNHGDGSNPDVEVTIPVEGIFIYRFSEGFNYPNANHYLDQLTNHIFAVTRRTNMDNWPRPGDRPWNDPGARKGHEHDHENRPTLKAIILDFSSVNNVDVTSVQQLIDVRNQLDRYVAPSVVDWHFASINNRWTKRALGAAGFGYPTTHAADGRVHPHKPIFSVAKIGGVYSSAEPTDLSPSEKTKSAQSHNSIIAADNQSEASSSDLKPDVRVAKSKSIAVLGGLNRPLFHIDLTSALLSAVANVREREEFEARGAGANVV